MLVAATLVVVGGLAYELTRAHLRTSLHGQLTATADSFRRAVAPADSGRELERAASDWLSIQALPEGQIAAVRLPSDEVLTTAGGPGLLDLAPAGDDLFRVSRPRWSEVDGPGGGARALSIPLVLRGDQRGTFVAVASRSGVEQTLSTLRTGILWASAGGLLFALLVGAGAVRRSVRPLAQMSSDIERIEASGDLDTRVASGDRSDEIGRLAASFNAMLDRLRAAFAAQRRLVMDASHELRTPLTVARGAIELLESELDDVEARRSASLATEELDRMRGIVEDLLLLSRLDEGMDLRAGTVDVELVVNEAVLRGLVLAPGRVEAACDQGLAARGDFERLLQVLTNLVSNAVHHGGPGVRVEVAARAQGPDVVIEVRDDGPGIDERDLPLVFERLYRASSARAGAHKGTGLGLAIARSLVEAMGGSISAESSPGAGAVFTIALPAAADAPAAPVAVRRKQ